MIEGKLAPLRQAHNGVSWAERLAPPATRLEANFTIGRSNVAFGSGCTVRTQVLVDVHFLLFFFLSFLFYFLIGESH